jgi:hypothetical protein
MNYLFICGTARSGTTAMWRLVTADERLVIGLERYSKHSSHHVLTTDLFTPERFLELRAGDTFYPNLCEFDPYYEKVGALLAHAEYVGDKIPKLFNFLDTLFANIPTAKVIFMLRNIIDVATSFESRANSIQDKSWPETRKTQAAIKEWRNSLLMLKKYHNDDRVFPVIYEEFFAANSSIEPLYQFLGLEPTQAAHLAHQALLAQNLHLEIKRRKRELSVEGVQQICETAPFALYREVLRTIRAK